VAHVTYPNLRAEMARHGVTNKDLSNEFACSIGQISRRFNLDVEFNHTEMKKIRGTFFPNLSLDYLFADEPLGNNEK